MDIFDPWFVRIYEGGYRFASNWIYDTYDNEIHYYAPGTSNVDSDPEQRFSCEEDAPWHVQELVVFLKQGVSEWMERRALSEWISDDCSEADDSWDWEE